MRERTRYELAISTAEIMYNILEAEFQRGERELDEIMIRLKDLSVYSLTHAEILEQREGPELLAFAMFFGATSDPRYHKNQKRIAMLSDEIINYEGSSEKVEREVKTRKADRSNRRKIDPKPSPESVENFV